MPATKGSDKNWVKHVMQTSFATYPPKGVFTASPGAIADAADVEGVAPGGLTSWQRMVLFHQNRGGKGLSKERRQALKEAIGTLSKRREERKAGTNGWDEKTLLPHELVPADVFASRLAEEAAARQKVALSTSPTPLPLLMHAPSTVISGQAKRFVPPGSTVPKPAQTSTPPLALGRPSIGPPPKEALP
jgi:hypothetical protein